MSIIYCIEVESKLKPNTNTNLIISNFLEQTNSRHNYFVSSLKSLKGPNVIQSSLHKKSTVTTLPNEETISRNGFLRPQKIITNQNNRSDSIKSASSLAAVRPSPSPQRFKSATNHSNNNNVTFAKELTEKISVDTFIGSSKARNAFFERLKVTEYLNHAKNNQNNDIKSPRRPCSSRPTTSRSNSGDKAKATVYDFNKIVYTTSDPLLDIESSATSSRNGLAHLNQFEFNSKTNSSFFSKPFNPKSNFANVTKIDKSFKSEHLVEHAYFYKNTNQLANNVNSFNTSNLIEEISQVENTIVEEDSVENQVDQKLMDEKQSIEKEILQLCKDIKNNSHVEDDFNKTRLHRERITNLLIRRNSIHAQEKLIQLGSITGNKLKTVYDTKNSLIHVRPIKVVAEVEKEVTPSISGSTSSASSTSSAFLSDSPLTNQLVTVMSNKPNPMPTYYETSKYLRMNLFKLLKEKFNFLFN